MMVKKRVLVLVVCLQFIAGSGGIFAQSNVTTSGEVYEQELLAIVALIEQGELDHALNKTEKIIKRYDSSRIAYVLKADILRAMNGELPQFAAGLDSKTRQYQDFRHELSNRFSSQQDTTRSQYHSLLPASVLDMGEHKYLLLAEMSTGRFFMFENKLGQPELVKDYYMSIGKAGFGKQVEGDNKTPVGLYHVTREIDGSTLPDLYGSGAFPVNYPNRVDRWRKRTGYGIWLHGTPSDTYSRAPLASEGCFVLSNDDYDDVAPLIRSAEKPPVLLVETVEWLTPDQHQQRKQTYLGILNQWAVDWESLDVERYLSHYNADNFNFGKDNFSEWSERKRQVGRGKEFIQLAINVNGLFIYPGEEDMFMVDFKQSYMSNNYQSQSQKQQYWKKDATGNWKIIFEG